MLILAPVMCIMSGIAVSASLSTYMKYLENTSQTAAPEMHQNGPKKGGRQA